MAMRRALNAAAVVAAVALVWFSGGMPVGAQDDEGGVRPPPLLDEILVGGGGVGGGSSIPVDVVSEAASANGLDETELLRIMATDSTARLDRYARLHYAESPPPPAEGGGSADPEPGPFPTTQTFTLHSRPGSNRVIYLDFDGHLISGTVWNDQYGLPATNAPAFDLDGNPASFTQTEHDWIQAVWQRVAEDYAPFAIDVTTQDPGAAAITRTGAADQVYGTRVLITRSDVLASTVCGGFSAGCAYIDVFDNPTNHAFFQPALVYGLFDPDSLGDLASHEAGHNFGLNHDGTTTGQAYYPGHGAWAPIMGTFYNRDVVQWSRGEYTTANNTEDDLAVIASNGAPLASDDHGNTVAAASSAGTTGTPTASGVIGTRADVDVFSFTQACAGTASLSVQAAPRGPNLDIQLRLLDAAGSEVAVADPALVLDPEGRPVGMDATIEMSLAAGTWYLEISGVGSGSALNTGYSDYASLGRYTVTGTTCVSLTLCEGRPPTVTIGSGQVPTAGNDIILGTAGDDTIDGLGGDDVICGGEGDDTLAGDTGNDQLYGGPGADTLNGGDGFDYLVGSVGVDFFAGDADADHLEGGSEGETMNGGAGDDVVLGYGGEDTLNGGDGGDYLWGGDGIDAYDGDAGRDFLEGGDDGEFMVGGLDDDIILGHGGNDSLYGDEFSTLVTAGGSDYLWGGAGGDRFVGGPGSDYLDGDESRDTMNGGAGNDFLIGFAGDDSLSGGVGDDYVWGGPGNDFLDGDEGADYVDGDTGDDRVRGDDGNDIILGQAGDDILEAGAGDDYLWGGTGVDSFAGDDCCSAGADYLDGGDEGESMSGGQGNDIIIGRGGDDTLYGEEMSPFEGGADYLSGGDGNDLLDGGPGAPDTCDGGPGTDTIDASCEDPIP